MCPSFLPLYDARKNGKFTGKYLQLFISHNHGCQYYVGEMKGEKFYPETHGRMAWNDFAYFAPEALIDDKKRHIMWAWLIDNLPDDFEKFGWSGVFSFPKVVWWENNMLRMAPAEELDGITYNTKKLSLTENEIKADNGEVFRLRAEWNYKKTSRCGFRIRIDESTGEGVDVFFDRENNTLVMDCTNSGCESKKVYEQAPLSLGKEENAVMDLFVDRSVIEVYVNEKQAICRRTFPTNPEKAVGIRILDGCEYLEKLEISDIAPTNMY
jgi:beta-fructofuranosidase